MSNRRKPYKQFTRETMTTNKSNHSESEEEQLKTVTKGSKDEGLHSKDKSIKEKEQCLNTMLSQYGKELQYEH